MGFFIANKKCWYVNTPTYNTTTSNITEAEFITKMGIFHDGFIVDAFICFLSTLYSLVILVMLDDIYSSSVKGNIMTKKFAFISNAAKRAFLNLPKEVQLQFSTDLTAVASNKQPFSPFKDISKSVGKGAIELIENGSPAYRAVYCAKYLDTVYILHAFTKTTNGVDKKAMDTASKRYKDMMAEVQKKEKESKQSKTPTKKPKRHKREK